jgi:hypothetical protein
MEFDHTNSLDTAAETTITVREANSQDFNADLIPFKNNNEEGVTYHSKGNNQSPGPQLRPVSSLHHVAFVSVHQLQLIWKVLCFP